MIGDASLREIVSADALRAVAGADFFLAVGRACRVLALALGVVNARAQDVHRRGAVFVLRAAVLHHDHNAGRDMGDADRRFRFVDVLTAGALRAHGLDPQVIVLDVDIDILDFRQHRNRRRRSVNAPLRLGIGYALYPVYAGFEFELREGAAALHLGDDFLEAANGAFAGGYHLDLPALQGGKTLIHPEQVAGEQRGLVAAGAGADFEHDVAVVHGILGQQRDAYLLLQ